MTGTGVLGSDLGGIGRQGMAQPRLSRKLLGRRGWLPPIRRAGRNMTAWPQFRKASDLVGSVFPVSETTILQTARKLGIGRKLGRTIIFSPEECARLYEVLPCPSALSVARNRLTGSCGVRSGESALKRALELATGSSPKKSERSVKPNFSPNRSTVVALRLPSLKPR